MRERRWGVLLGAVLAAWLWTTGYLTGERAALLRERDRLAEQGERLQSAGDRLATQTLTHTEWAPPGTSWFERPAPGVTLGGGCWVTDGSGQVWPGIVDSIEMAPVGSDVGAALR